MSALRTWLGPLLVGGSLLSIAHASASAQEVRWRHDYLAARKEAREKKLPLFLDFGTKSCFWCKKLDESTFKDTAVAGLLNTRYIPLKVDGDREPELVKTLNIRSYPTLVFASADGKILAAEEGYVEPARFRAQLQSILTALGSGELAANQPPSQPANQPSGMLQVAATTVQPDPERQGRARVLLSQAQELFRARSYVCSLEICQQLAQHCADLPEGAEGQKLGARLRADPDVAGQLSERLAEMYLDLATAHAERAELAASYLERAVQVSPNSRHAQIARQRLAQLHLQPPDTARATAP